MKFSIYGRYDLEVVRKDGRWLVYRIEDGRRRPERGLIVTADIAAEDVGSYLEDLLHEEARPGTSIERIE